MSEIISRSDSNLAHIADSELLKAVRAFEEEVKKKHQKVSEEETNPNHVKQKAGMDFVEFPYMKAQVNKHYPLWSFKNLKIVHEMLNSGWVVVQGELHFYDEGVLRVGACAAAHRIAFKKGATRTPENIVDLSNDVKAAVTDAMKKGFNTYMNISDDIYRQIEIRDIDNDEKQILYDMVEQTNPSGQGSFYNYVDNRVTKNNFSDIAIKLLKAVYSYQKEQNEEEATQLLAKFKKRLKDEFDITLDSN